MKRYKVFFALFFALLFVAAGGAFAQGTGGKPVGITDQILASILGGSLFGIPMIGLSQLVKTAFIKLFKLTEPTKPWVGYLSSAIVCAALAAITLSGLGILNLQNFLTGMFMAWLVANGYYKRQNAAAVKAVEIVEARMNGG